MYFGAVNGTAEKVYFSSEILEKLNTEVAFCCALTENDLNLKFPSQCFLASGSFVSLDIGVLLFTCNNYQDREYPSKCKLCSIL